MNIKSCLIILALLGVYFMPLVRASAMHGGSCSHTTTAEDHSLEGEEHAEEEHDEEHEDEPTDSYDLGLAIASVFVVGVVSFIGAGFPVLLELKRHPWLVLAIKLGAFAGSGVMLATGFVHMLFAANENLTSDCLSESWLNRYGPWAFLFTVITIILLQTMDYIFGIFLYTTNDIGPGRENLSEEEEVRGLSGSLDDPEICKSLDCKSRILLINNRKLPEWKAYHNLIVSELSIGIHSIIIGLALGLTSSDEFVALFVAIIFHQLLEGVALGSMASESGFGWRVILSLAGVYSLSTPTGIAIGIGVRESLDTNSSSYLYTTGILDSISAGALIYLALGDHMNSVRNQAGWMRKQNVWTQLSCFAAFYIGAAVLLVIAIWA
eukprot:jgi/Picsp_1/2651/NSC_00881-R1_cation transporter